MMVGGAPLLEINAVDWKSVRGVQRVASYPFVTCETKGCFEAAEATGRSDQAWRWLGGIPLADLGWFHCQTRGARALCR